MAKKYDAFTRLVWLDLEMTGLDTAIHRTIEAAALVTDADLNILGEGVSLVIHQSDEVLSQASEFATKTFTASGLFDKVRQSTVSTQDAQAQILRYLRDQGVTEGMALLAGNSISNDRRFLRAEMPELHDWIHYRSVDVSSIKMLTRTWLPAIFNGVPEKAESHLALADIHESIVELRYYKAQIFDKVGGLPTV